MKWALERKFRIIKDGEKVFGEGPCTLLEKVERLGSLNKAAQELNMSYSKAWSIIKKAEEELNIKLLETQIGGEEGGGSYLTDAAKDLIKAYRDFCKEANDILEELFKKYFKDV